MMDRNVYFDGMTSMFLMHLWLSTLQVDARNIDGSTPLCDACAAGSLECVKLLLEYGATVNPPLFTFSPLHEACMGGTCCCMRFQANILFPTMYHDATTIIFKG